MYNIHTNKETKEEIAAGKRVNARTAGRVLAGFRRAPRISISQAHDGNSLIIKGEVNGRPCKLTLDTGASRTVISSQLANRVLGDSFVRYDHINLVTATGQRITVRGEREVELKLGNIIYQHKVIIADIVDDCILGLDFMRQHNCEIDVNQGVLKYGSEEVFMEGAPSGKVYCLKTTTLPPRSETMVPVRLPQNSGQRNRCSLIERLDEDHAWKMARTLVRANNVASVRILNPSEKEQVIKKGTLMGTCEEVAWLRKCEERPSRENVRSAKVNISNLLKDCSEDLSEGEREKAKKMLLQYADVFSTDDADIGKTGLVQHKINTGNELPIRQRPRRLPCGSREYDRDACVCQLWKGAEVTSGSDYWHSSGYPTLHHRLRK
uniref:Peptidase A2 domain-containing protein n=1 Tax=Heliothis virescens TaxID=7102 RepID=A0A2A4K0Q2_HELVI